MKSNGLRTWFFMTWGKIRSRNSFLNLNENIISFPSCAILLKLKQNFVLALSNVICLNSGTDFKPEASFLVSPNCCFPFKAFQDSRIHPFDIKWSICPILLYFKQPLLKSIKSEYECSYQWFWLLKQKLGELKNLS